jgi:hypothetical protein
MKKASEPKPKSAADDLRPEYDFDYSRAKPNRFSERFQAGSVAVVLDPDVASVFRSSESVNTLLRSVIAALPAEPVRPKARSKAGARKEV